MALVVPDVGAAYILGKVFGAAASLTLRLYATNVTPADASTNASFTTAAGGGYADKTLAGAWTVGDDGGGIQQAAFAQQTWTFTGALTTNPTIYGYEVLDGTTLIFAELLPAPFTPATNGDQLKITPVFKSSKGTPT
jgi:hypothetical protein